MCGVHTISTIIPNGFTIRFEYNIPARPLCPVGSLPKDIVPVRILSTPHGERRTVTTHHLVLLLALVYKVQMFSIAHAVPCVKAEYDIPLIIAKAAWNQHFMILIRNLHFGSV